jgi:hypothetical protein
MTPTDVVHAEPAVRSVIVEEAGADLAADRRSGPAAAVVLAAGIACFALGMLSILAAASGAVADVLTLTSDVGEASGLSTITTATFFVVWGSFTLVWRHADPSLTRVAAVSGALIVFGLLATFPPVFNLVGG